MNQLNCPNCGAPIQAVKCPYCGTVFYDFADISDDEPTYIRVKYDGDYLAARARMMNGTLKMEQDALPELSIDFVILPDDRGVYFYRAEVEGRNVQKER